MTETPQTAHTPELLPCPFCGSNAARPNRTQTAVICRNCGARGPILIQEGEHEIEWNRRPGIQDPEGAIALLKDCPIAELAEISDRAVEDAEAALRPDGSEVYSHGDDARRKKWKGRLKRWSAVKEWIAKLSAISPKV